MCRFEWTWAWAWACQMIVQVGHVNIELQFEVCMGTLTQYCDHQHGERMLTLNQENNNLQ